MSRAIESFTQVRIQGKNTFVPSLITEDRTIVSKGSWLKTAEVQDEAFVSGEIVCDPKKVISELKNWSAKPDIFTFSQKFTDPKPKHPYYMEWDNYAVIPITTYDDWMKNRIKKDVKENLRRAVKREKIVVKTSPYDDTFILGVKKIYDETPLRQGKRFWHHGKSFDELKEIHGTYCERAEYIGAYFENELAGFIKMVYTDNYAKTMHVISNAKYHRKRPTNVLIAKAVETCEEKGIEFFVYGEYNFINKRESSLKEFKIRNGFEERRYPRYFVPLTLKGELALKLGIHYEWKRKIPEPAKKAFYQIRTTFAKR